MSSRLSLPIDDSDCNDSLTVTTAVTSSMASTAATSLEPGLLNENVEDSNHHVEERKSIEEEQRRRIRQKSHKKAKYDQFNSNPFSFLNPSNFVNFTSGSQRQKSLIPITRAELRRHNSLENGVWIVCGTSVYDVTDYVEHHPGGIKSILRRSGGADCTRDMNFHSTKAVKLWKSMKIGYLVPSPVDECENVDKNAGSKKYKKNEVSIENINAFRNTFLSSNNGSSKNNNEKHFLEQTEQCTIS